MLSKERKQAIYILQMFSEKLHPISWCTYCGNKLMREPECRKFEREPKAVTGGGFTGGEREREGERGREREREGLFDGALQL